MSVTVSSADQAKLARSLVNPDKEIRDKTCANLTKYLSDSEQNLSELEMMKLWKALYYCYWLSDKLEVQIELAMFLCNLIDVLPNSKMILLFFRCFLKTLMREWPIMDHHRLDKFYKLIRLMIRKVLFHLTEKNFNKKLTNKILDVLKTEVLTKSPNGIRFHIFDIFLSELHISCAGEIDEDNFLFLYSFLLDLMANENDPIVVDRIGKKVFESFVDNHARENDVGEENTSQQLFKNVNTAAIQKMLFEKASSTETREAIRPRLYALHKKYSLKTSIAFVDDNNINSHENKKKRVREEKGQTLEKLSEEKLSEEPIKKDSKKKKNKTVVESEEKNEEIVENVSAISKRKVNEENVETSSKKTPNSKKTKNIVQKEESAEVIVEKETKPVEEASVPKKEKKSKKEVKEEKSKIEVAEDAKPVQAESVSNEPENVDFIASKKFIGAKPGFAFKKGAQGQGYYKDLGARSSKAGRANKQQKNGKTERRDSTPTPQSSNKDEDLSPVKKRVSFGKKQSKDYNSSVRGLKSYENSPVQISPRSALKKK